MPARLLVSTFALLCVAAAPTFKTQEIDTSLQIGYGVVVVDVNDDKKPDVVVADKERVIWFENPTWKLGTITQGTTKPDNVSIAPHDIDGDGKVDFALAAGWQPGNTKEPSTLQWLRRGKSLDEPWEMLPIKYDEPTLHRIRWDDNKLVTVPLMGRGSTKEKNWSEAGVKIHAFAVPTDPTKPDWTSKTLTDAFRVAHNFFPTPAGILVASYEGAHLLKPDGSIAKMGEGDQSNPDGNRGASEIKQGKLTDGGTFVATIEPWHGHQVVVYENRARHIVDDQLRWGHAISCADLDGDGGDEIIAGVRDPLPGKTKPGVRVYGRKSGVDWEPTDTDGGVVAVKALAIADLNGDGKPDIVAVGRQTKNVRIYWNQRP